MLWRVLFLNNRKRRASLKKYIQQTADNDGKRLVLPPAAVLWFFRGSHTAAYSGRVTVRY